MPKDFELKVRLSQAPDTASDGSSAARAAAPGRPLVRANGRERHHGTSPTPSRTRPRTKAAAAGGKALPSDGQGRSDEAGEQGDQPTTIDSRCHGDTVDVSVEILLDVDPSGMQDANARRATTGAAGATGELRATMTSTDGTHRS